MESFEEKLALTELDVSSIDELIFDVMQSGYEPLYIKYGDRIYCCDMMTGYAFSDTSIESDENPNSLWKIISDRFGSLDNALDQRLFDGKSVREAFDEMTFYQE